MKTCEQYEELASAYVDGEASDDETAELFFHLGTCRGCRHFLSSVVRLDRFLKDSGIVAPLPVWKRKFAMTYQAAAAVILLILLSGILLLFQKAQPQPAIGSTQTEYIYVTMLSPVDVVASPLPPAKSN